MSNFPPLRLAVLNGLVALKAQVLTEPEFLDSPECPYDKETVTVLRDLLAPKEIEKIVIKEVKGEEKVGRGRPSKDVRLSEDDQQMVLEELRNTIEALKNMGTGDVSLPTNERIQIAKTKASILEQLLKMMERHTTVSQMEAFKETVIAILEDFMTETDREQIMARLDQYR